MSIKTYTLKHSANVTDLLWDYNTALNRALDQIWGTVTWKEWKIPGKKQVRLYPRYIKTNSFKKKLRDILMEEWRMLGWATHWVDSAIKTAYSIMASWKKNYENGDRKRRQPKVRRPFARIQAMLYKLVGDKLRITTKPHQYIYVDLSKRWFKLGHIGEPVITPDRIHIPIHTEPDKDVSDRSIGWDSNMKTLDGWSPDTGWIKINTGKLYTAHVSSFEKKRNVQSKASKSKKGKRLLAKYKRREKNRATDLCRKTAKIMRSLAQRHGFEALNIQGLYKLVRRHVKRRDLHRTDWRTIASYVKERREVVEVDPRDTSKTCSRCGYIHKDLRGATFKCPRCGLTLDRQLNAAINIYLKMEGLSPSKASREWWDHTVIPSLGLGGFAQTGAEWKDRDELVSGLHETVKPQILLAP